MQKKRTTETAENKKRITTYFFKKGEKLIFPIFLTVINLMYRYSDSNHQKNPQLLLNKLKSKGKKRKKYIALQQPFQGLCSNALMHLFNHYQKELYTLVYLQNIKLSFFCPILLLCRQFLA